MDLKENASQYSNVASMWDKKWGHISNKWVQIIKNNDLIENHEKIKCIDLCCGTGNFIKNLALYNKNPKSKFLGYDLNQDMLDNANSEDKRINFKQKDITTLLFERCNLISCTYNSLNYINSFNSISKILKSSIRSLKKNGKLIFDFKPFEFYQNIPNTKVITNNQDSFLTEIINKTENYIDLKVTCFLNKENNIYEKIVFTQREYYIDTKNLLNIFKSEDDIKIKFVKKNLTLSSQISEINNNLPVYLIYEKLI